MKFPRLIKCPVKRLTERRTGIFAEYMIFMIAVSKKVKGMRD